MRKYSRQARAEEGLVMRWPRGRYNGRRFAGIEIKLEINVLWWYWLPILRLSYIHGSYFHWLCFHVWWDPAWDRKEPSHG